MGIAAILLLVLVGGVVLWTLSGFYIIRPHELGIVERLGVYNEATNPGLHWRPRWLSKIVKRHDMRSLQLSKSFEARTQGDGPMATVQVFFEYRVDPDQPGKAYYSLENPLERLELYTRQVVTATLFVMTLEDALAGRNVIAAAIEEQVVAYAAANGYLIDKVKVTKVEAEMSIRTAMDKQAAFDREKALADAEADAANTRKVLAARAAAEAAERNARAAAAGFTSLTEAIRLAAKKLEENDGLTPQQALQVVLKIQANAGVASFASNGGASHVFINGGSPELTSAAVTASTNNK
jgi:membrane protease subunit HflK